MALTWQSAPLCVVNTVTLLFRNGAQYDQDNGRGKLHPRTGHEGPCGEMRYSYTLSLTSAIDGVSSQRYAPAVLHPWERPGTHITGGWVGPSAGLNGCGKSRPHWDSIPVPSSP